MKDDGGKTFDSNMVAGQKNYSGVIIRALTRKNRFIKQYLEAEMYLSRMHQMAIELYYVFSKL
jgi:hypothetical protein